MVMKGGTADKPTRPPLTTFTLEKTVRWKDVKDLVFQAIEYGSPSDFEAKKLAQLSLDLLGRKQQKSSVNLSFYSAMCGGLDHLSDDELRRLALQCITRCTNNESNCHNITSIAQKVGVINSRYFDFMYRGKPYLPKKDVGLVEQELAVVGMTEEKVEGMTDNSESGVFDISKSLGYLPYGMD